MTDDRSLAIPVGPLAARIFFGFKARHLDKQSFFSELGQTFIPGTPLMQAPMALSAYLPAVIDPVEGSALPDEVALIVYASRDIYSDFRANSLSRRMYTRSHHAVFDMSASMAQFPGPLDAPEVREGSVGIAQYVYLFDRAVDWQAGYTRVCLVQAGATDGTFQVNMLDCLSRLEGSIKPAVDQIVAGVAPGFAALWIHGDTDLGDIAALLGALPSGSKIVRDLDAIPASVIGDTEKGVTITGTQAFTMRFSRHRHFFEA